MISLDQLPIERTEIVGGKGLSLLDSLVDGELELGEHGLAEECAPQLLEGVPKIEQPLGGARGSLEHPVQQEGLVQGGRYFSDENGVVRVDEVLGLIGEARVEGVSPLVRQCRNGFVVIVVVHQNVRVDVVDMAVHVRP